MRSTALVIFCAALALAWVPQGAAHTAGYAVGEPTDADCPNDGPATVTLVETGPERWQIAVKGPPSVTSVVGCGATLGGVGTFEAAGSPSSGFDDPCLTSDPWEIASDGSFTATVLVDFPDQDGCEGPSLELTLEGHLV